ncbi:ADP-ribosyl cyclase/cyclic ADP-ribose hydrolase [Citrus sinensis]|uniref:ADP-ribosyl cyclase/cyclic ADP-ribose hydrolase n=1 Tax=Citrus sinensis TaxID=2711 RepID=A0ACB8MAS0_CITSI|nr:ADP-ribosyl cyclase/cyclic ADP-ribose hydrolase [Citrus sinensis]
MASSSCIYEVFLNFRGEDTRAIFTCHLYDGLSKRKKIRTFIDDEGLGRGDEISPALLNAIQGSKISVVVFSKDYASSKWCLNELVKILDCKNMKGQIIIPVFYGVSPSDVRHQTGIFGVGFGKLEQQFKEQPEMVRKWRDALTESSHLAGHESTKFRHDAQLLDKIVENVLKKLEKITVSTDSSNGLVGLNSRIEQIKPFLCMDLWDTVHFEKIRNRGWPRRPTKGNAFDNIPLFTKGRVRRMKVLIVLDDVNKDEQLEGLIGGLDQYGPGSRIVVTTRDKGVLENFGVEKIYRVNGLEFYEAFELFYYFAFKENHCPEDFKRDSRRVVKYADGNPLVLKVLGSSLKRKSHWGNVLDDLNRICESDIHDIHDILKISFNELMPKMKSIFLDIACFFEGEDKDFVTRILDDYGSYGLEVLIDKSLITVSHNCLRMHDLLQEMGREIVRQESEKEPGKRSRLWDPKEIRRVLKHNKFYEIEKLPSMSTEEQLSYSKVQLPNGLDYLPKKLRYLHWDTYPLRTLPSNFKPKNLVELNLRFSKVEQPWEGEKACVPSSIQNFKYLSALSFEGCKSLRSFPSNLHFVCPVTINFSSCVNLIEFPQISGKITRLYLGQSAIEEVPSSIECLTDLEKLDLRDCRRLKRISTRFCKLKSLVDLFLHGCLNLERFPEILEKMEHLKHIYLQRTAITELPSSFENLLGLESLSVRGCSKLDKLPDNIGNLESLAYILADGSAISQLPSSVADSNVLRYLWFPRCRNLVSLPPLLLSGLSSLECLHLRDCAVTDIPQEIGCLSSLEELDLSGNSFESLPVSIKQLSQLSSLDLSDCNMLRSLPELPSCLGFLNLSGCNMLQSLPELPLRLRRLRAGNCKLLQSLPEIRSSVEELDASVPENLSKYSNNPRVVYPTEISHQFTNCLKLNEKANNRILADLRLRIQHMTIALLRRLDERVKNKKRIAPKACTIALPGSEIPDWFRNQSSGHLMSIQLLSHSFCRNLIGFAFCAVLGFKQDLDFLDTIGDGRQFSSLRDPFVSVRYRFRLETKTVSEAKHVNRYNHFEDLQRPIDSDHVILGFCLCMNVGFPDGNNHTTVSFEFFPAVGNALYGGYGVKRCGLCPVYANPNETKANTFTLNFATEV